MPLLLQGRRRAPLTTIDVATLHQTIRGIGGTFKHWDDADVTPSAGAVNATAQDLILKAAIQDCGLSILWPDTYDAGTLPYTNDKNQAKDVEQVALVAQMGNYGTVQAGGKPIGTSLSHSDPTDFCTQTLARIDYWYQQGVALPFWGIKNEPALSSPTILGAFLRDAIKNMGPVLAGRGQGATKFVVSTDSKPSTALTACNVVAADATAMQYVLAFSTHLYDATFPPDQPNYDGTDMATLRDLAASKGVEFWMDEWYTEKDSNSWKTWAQTIHDLFTVYNCNAVMQYLPWVLDQLLISHGALAGLIRIDSSGSSYTGFTKLPAFYVTRQWARYVRPGMQRCAASDAGSVNVSAFTGGGFTTVVLWNSGAACERRLSGITGGFVEGSVYTGSGAASAVYGAGEWYLPANSITTLRFTA